MSQEASLIAQKNRYSNQESLFSIRIGDIGWFLLFNALAFQVFFQEIAGGIASYIDEAAALIVLFTSAVFDLCNVQLHNPSLVSRKVNLPIVFLILAIMLGVIANLISGVCKEIDPVLIDVLTFCKVPAVLLCCLAASRDGSSGYKLLWYLLVKESQLLIVVMCVCAMANLATGGNALDMNGGFRYGIPSFCFIFYHPEVVNLLVVGLIAILLADDPKKHKTFILAGLLVMCATLRWKAIGFAALVVYILLLRGRNELSVLKVLTALAIAALVAWGQVSTYYDSESTARSLLTRDSIEVALNYMPFGSGFGTFGSAVTADVAYYSPLYFEFGYEAVYGLSPLTPSYISDTFWPTVLAQLGFIGAVCYTASIAILFWRIYKKAKEVRIGLAVAVLVFYFVISSTSASALFAPQWVFLSVIMLLICRKCIPEFS